MVVPKKAAKTDKSRMTEGDESTDSLTRVAFKIDHNSDMNIPRAKNNNARQHLLERLRINSDRSDSTSK